MPTLNATRGRFIITRMEPTEDQLQNKRGLDMRVLFSSHYGGDRFALIQAVRCMYLDDEGRPDERYEGGIGGTPDNLLVDDWHIDAVSTKCPAFGLEVADEDRRGPLHIQWRAAKTDTNTDGSYKGALGFVGRTYAMMHDFPTRTVSGRPFHHEFEVVALRVGEYEPGAVLGVLAWGYRVTAQDVVTADTPTILAAPSPSWVGAAEAWNQTARLRIPSDSTVWTA